MRGDGAVEDGDEDWPPKDERVVGDDDGFNFPLRQRTKVLLPKFRLKMAALHLESPPLIFLGQKTLYTRRWAPEVGWAAHHPPGRAWGAWRALVSCGHQEAPL